MKRQIFVLLMVFAVATGTALWAQTTGTAAPPSQQIDQSGQPETGPGPDVDVDVGRNAEDGVVDVDVNRTTDPDTAAQGNDTMGTMSTTDTAVGGTSDDLPDTASSTPLVGLIGLLSLAGGLALKARH